MSYLRRFLARLGFYYRPNYARRIDAVQKWPQTEAGRDLWRALTEGPEGVGLRLKARLGRSIRLIEEEAALLAEQQGAALDATQDASRRTG